MGVATVRYRYRLRTGAAERAALLAVFDSCRFCWNQALGRWVELWRHEHVSFYYGDADRELTDWRGRFEWLAAQPSVPQQQVLRDLYRAISAFFDKTNPVGRPQFKTKKSGYATARWTTRGLRHPGDRCRSPPGRPPRGSRRRRAHRPAGGVVETVAVGSD